MSDIFRKFVDVLMTIFAFGFVLICIFLKTIVDIVDIITDSKNICRNKNKSSRKA